MFRTIDQIYQGAPFHMVGDGFRVSNYFPSATERMKRMSPFFLLDYHPPLRYSPTELRRGVGSHPHRGFETVTVAYEGAVAHHDSAGNGGIIQPGDAQWMTAGSGILHNEYHAEAFARQGGIMHMAQIWVNLPKRFKRTAPKYQSVTANMIPEIALAKNSGSVRVIAGNFGDAQGAAATFTPANMLDIRLKAGGHVSVPSPKFHNAGLLVLQGQVTVNEIAQAREKDFVLFRNDGDTVDLDASSDALILFLSGEPIEEPLVHYGPFVMNTADEINEAVTDFNHGRFGVLSD